jgi:hypothetical protein
MGYLQNLETKLSGARCSLLKNVRSGALLPLILVLNALSLCCSGSDHSIHPILPSETPLIKGPAGMPWVTLRLRSGKQFVAMVDTGSRDTILDESLNPDLGTPVGTATVAYPGIKRARASVFKAELYVGGVQLLTGGRILTAPRGKVAILGMDCLRHYCVQLDFTSGRIRFLDPKQPQTLALGQRFPISISPWTGYVSLRENFVGCKDAKWVVDTGGSGVDALLNPKLFEQTLLRFHISSAPMGLNGTNTRGAILPRGNFGSESYSNLVVGEVRRDIWPNAPNVLGLRFLARHVVTLNFPKRVMYLLRTDDPLQK